ncbi:superfamily SPOUT methylase [Cryptosporidium bovis]|uniref:superfamily SPOUT methylase n=1 Tax=Cryptosporidium bovis TaxID=310047 RepID=UPI00351A575C|nr:superfamily SPOUT methylase [Cryptosporidium bovis]
MSGSKKATKRIEHDNGNNLKSEFPGKKRSRNENNSKEDILSRIPFAGSPINSTLSVAIPASIAGNAQSFELRAYLVGQIARMLTVFGVNEVIIYEDKSKDVFENGGRTISRNIHTSNNNDKTNKSDSFACSKWMEFFVKNLRYLETPQYLRKSLFNFDSDLKYAGLQNPLDAPHHMRISEWIPYRQGTVVPGPKLYKGEIPKEHKNNGSWVNCGLPSEVWVSTTGLEVNQRITVKMSKDSENLHKSFCDEFNSKGRYSNIKSYFTGKVVDDSKPLKKGIYWGYKVRPAKSLGEAMHGSEYCNGYDLIIGTSERGDPIDKNFKFSSGVKMESNNNDLYKHILIVFGGLGGLEDVLEDPQFCIENGEGRNNKYLKNDPSALFDMYINICPEQKSRTIRTEEALGLALALLRPYIIENNNKIGFKE